jgi:hypothetical protein
MLHKSFGQTKLFEPLLIILLCDQKMGVPHVQFGLNLAP